MHAACLRPFRPLVTGLFASLLAAGSATIGCGSDGSTSAAASSGNHGDGPCGLVDADNSEWCQGDAVDPNCSAITNQTNDVCGIALPNPGSGVVLTRSTNLKEYSGSGPPDVACFEMGHYPAKPATSSMVKIQGHAKIFNQGCNSHDLRIEVFQVQRGGSADGDLGALVGTAVVTDPETTCETTGRAVDNDSCGTRYECAFEYDGVPTETELVIKTSSPTTMKDWASLYDYNIYIPNHEVSGGAWQHDVRALAADDYSVIPRAAIGQAITPGNGVIAGEIHDCGDVRLSGAVVGIDASSAGLFYFNSNEEAPLPDVQASFTSVLGLYAAFDVQAGPIVVGAMGTVDDKQVTLGYYRARIFPDSVTAVTLHGMQPFQVP
jgi:hypothetical protein